MIEWAQVQYINQLIENHQDQNKPPLAPPSWRHNKSWKNIHKTQRTPVSKRPHNPEIILVGILNIIKILHISYHLIIGIIITSMLQIIVIIAQETLYHRDCFVLKQVHRPAIGTKSKVHVVYLTVKTDYAVRIN